MAKRLLQLIRYRFLLFAGLFPYFLGAAVAYHTASVFNVGLFFTGLAGIFFTLVGVEAFNEYFDWILGTDRVFQLEPRPVTKGRFYLGIAAFLVALLFAVYLTIHVGTGIMLFALAGFAAAAGYLGPPVKFAYRGLGELVIALAYGPAMVMGSYYLQTGAVAVLPLIISIIPAALLFLIAIINEVPDYLQDQLVGKRNICVRLGRRGVVWVYSCVLIFVFAALAVMIFLKVLPPLALAAFLFLPVAYRNCRIAFAAYESPREFLPAIRGTILLYLLVMFVVIVSYAINRPLF